MYPSPASVPQRHASTPSIASVSTLRADPFIDHQNDQHYAESNPILFQSPTAGQQVPPVPPARSSSLLVSQAALTTVQSPGSPLTTRVPSVQVIHPTPTKKKGRPRSTASGDTAIASPSRRSSRLSDTDSHSVAVSVASDKEEAKKARVREKGKERQRRKRERDKALKESTKPSKSSTSLAPSHSMSVPSSVSSTYSSLPHSQSMYSISTSPNASLIISNSSTSLSGASSPTNLFSPGTPADIIWTGKTRRTAGTHSSSDLLQPGSPPPKRRKSEPEPDDFRMGLGVSLAQYPDNNATIRRPKPRRTTSLALTEASTAPSVTESDASDWGARSPTPPPITLPHVEDPVTSRGQFFASTIIHACQASGLADVMHTQLKLGKSELDMLRTELGLVYDRWAKKALEEEMAKVSLSESSASETVTPHRPRAETHSGPPGSPIISTHNRQRSLSSASMLARGLVINPVPAPPAHSSVVNKWDSPKAHGPGSDSPTHSNLQTPSTGQGTSFIIPNHDPVPNASMSAPSYSHNHYRSHTDPAPGYEYRSEWRPPSGGLESPLTMTKSGRPPTGDNGRVGSHHLPQINSQSSGLIVTPPHARQHSAPSAPAINSANSTPLANPLPHLNQPHFAYQMSSQYHRLPHAAPHPYATYVQPISQNPFSGPSHGHPHQEVPYTPSASSWHQGSFHQPVPSHPFTPSTPMPLKGSGDAPMNYMPSFMNGYSTGNGTPPLMVPMGALMDGMGEMMPQVQQQAAMQASMAGSVGHGDQRGDSGEDGSGMVMG